MASRYPNINGTIFECKVEAIFDEHQIAKQLYALQQLANSPCWSQLFLCKDACIGPATKPSDIITELNKDQKDLILQDVLEVVSPNDSASAIQAAADTGEKVLSSAVFQYFLRIGYHVVGVASSNPAANLLHESITDSQTRSSGTTLENMKPVRFHRWAFEQGHASEYGEEERPGIELTPAQQAGDAMYQEISLRCALEHFRKPKTNPKKRAFVNPVDSLSHTVLEIALAEQVKIMGHYRPRDAGEEGGGPREDDVDMMKQLRTNMEHLNRESLGAWNDDDRKKSSECFEPCAEGVIKDRRCLVLTPVMVTRKILRLFAHGAKGVFVIFEEASMGRDTDTALALYGAPWARETEALIMSLDYSLFERLMLSQFLFYTINIQYRARPELIAFPNQRAYNEQQFRNLVRMLNFTRRADNQRTRADLPDVDTVDSYQGQDKSFVLYEYTVSEANDKKDLGFLMDDQRMNMACTRAKNYPWLVSSMSVCNGTLFAAWKTTEIDKVSKESKL